MRADVSGEATLGVSDVSLDVDEGALCADDVAVVARNIVVENRGRRPEHVNGRAREITVVHLRVARSGVVHDDVVGQVQTGSRGSGNLPTLVLIVVFTDKDGFFAGFLDGVVLCDHVGRAVNPQTVPTTDGTDGVAMEFNLGATNADARPV